MMVVMDLNDHVLFIGGNGCWGVTEGEQSSLLS